MKIIEIKYSCDNCGTITEYPYELGGWVHIGTEEHYDVGKLDIKYFCKKECLLKWLKQLDES